MGTVSSTAAVTCPRTVPSPRSRSSTLARGTRLNFPDLTSRRLGLRILGMTNSYAWSLTTAHLTALERLAEDGPMTPFEMPNDTDDARHWGPTFTELKREGMTELTGQRRPTGLGRTSGEHRLTTRGRDVVDSLRMPVSV